MLPNLTLLNHIFVSLLTDLAEEGLPFGQELEGFGAFFGIKFLSHFSLVDEDAIFTTISLKEEVSEINKQNQLISVHRKDRVQRYYRVFCAVKSVFTFYPGKTYLTQPSG